MLQKSNCLQPHYNWISVSQKSDLGFYLLHTDSTNYLGNLVTVTVLKTKTISSALLKLLS